MAVSQVPSDSTTAMSMEAYTEKNDRAMAEAVGLDPERPAKLARLACVPRDADDEGSDSTDDAEDGREGRQPEDVAILACLQPGCERYFRSVAHDLLIVWCPMFELRWIFALGVSS